MSAQPCTFLPDENAQGCLVERARRFREHRPDIRPWEKNLCENCKPGRDRAEASRPPEETDSHIARPGIKAWRELGRRGRGPARKKATTNGINQMRPNEKDYHHEKNYHHEKEEIRMDATKKDLVLRKIQEHKAITRGALAGMIRLKKEEVEPIAKALEAEGKIKTWPGKRSDSMIYTTPDLPNPLAEIDGKKPGAKKDVPKAASPSGPRKSQAIPHKPASAQAPGSIPPKNGGGGGDTDSASEVIAAALAALRRRREITDRAIQALEEMTA